MNEDWLIRYLSERNPGVKGFSFLPKDKQVRAWMNITMPDGLSEEYYGKQDGFLQDLLSRKTVADAASLPGQVCLYEGDITLLKADAIVNAANSEMLGCFIPLHGCIDNAIHSFAGLQVRRDLMRVMGEQGHPEPTGKVKVTKGYNLPATYIFHTVGPIADGRVTEREEALLESCYRSCLKKAVEMNLRSIAFCSISTGVFGYPIEKAAPVAIRTVRDFLASGDYGLKVIFDVFSERDRQVYERSL